MKIKLSIFVMFMFLLTAGKAVASWEEYIEAVKPSVEVTNLQNQTKVTHDFSPISPMTYQVYDAISSAEYGISKEVETEIINALYDADKITNRLRLNSYNFKIQGAMQIVLQEKSGVIAAKVGGFSIRVYAKIKDKRFLVPTSASMTITSEPIWLDADYDVYTGNLSNFVLNEVVYNTNVSTSWINPFGQLAKYVMKSLIPQKINSGITSLQDDLAGANYSLLGLDDLLPNGRFVINGIDAGQKTKLALTSLMSGESLAISMLRKDFYFNTGQQHNSADITINFSNQYQLKLFNHLVIGTYWQSCAPNNPTICDQVP